MKLYLLLLYINSYVYIKMQSEDIWVLSGIQILMNIEFYAVEYYIMCIRITHIMCITLQLQHHTRKIAKIIFSLVIWFLD